MEKLKMHSPDLTAQNIQKLAELFPGCVTEMRDAEGKVTQGIDFDQLRQELSGSIVEGPRERYHLDWPGKREAILAANAPIAKTLRPSREESVNFDTTKNLFIEGDNLDALKLLQETYLGKVKLIYIDPPYNTGNDFIYEDDFSEGTEKYFQRSNQEDTEGNRLVVNTEANGRFHSDWLTMLYPRLKLARNLLKDDGFIVVSIDDAEMPRLRDIMDEVFGNPNFIAVLVFDRNRKNDAKLFSVGHEYMVIYAKNKAVLRASGTKLRTLKEGVDELRVLFDQLRQQYKDDWPTISKSLKAYFKEMDEGDPRLALSRYSKVDERGPFRTDGNPSWPGGGGPRYDVNHPVTGKPVRVPGRGWVWSTMERAHEEIEKGNLIFGPDENTTPGVRMTLFEQDSEVMHSVIFSYAQTATQDFAQLFEGKVPFENPKSVQDLKNIILYLSKEDDIVLDCFAGSGTTGHGVFLANSQQKGRRRFILVQLPVEVNPKSDAGSTALSLGLSTISEVSKARLRKAAQDIIGSGNHLPDVGFRTLKIDTSNMLDVYYAPDAVIQEDLLGQIDNIKSDRKDPEDLLFQVLVDWGLDLALPIATETIEGKQVFFVDQNALAACFDTGVTDEMVKAIAQRKPLRAVFRDSSYGTDSVKINVEQIFKLLSPETEVRSI